MNRAELLAPAGDMKALEAALIHGADAVYLGASAFGARASAGFDEASLQQALDLAHLHHRRIYVTVNTLIKQAEWEDATRLLRRLDALQVDAAIVQDLGLASWIKRELPSLPLHGSTQMSVHNAQGARLIKDHGFSRVVLARECSLEAIRSVSATGIETEVFVHGALCVSVSGQCLLSSQIGGRSGNRGRCAQPCRLRYLYRNKEGAWLSPRDLRLLRELPQLLKAGATSFKIEGRLKRPEYVAVVTRAYRRALDAALEDRPNPHLQEDERELLQIFNRGGFTRGFAFGESDASLINPEQVSHEGLPLGEITGSQARTAGYRGELQLSATLRHGDMLQIRSRKPQEMIYSGPSADPGDRLQIRHHQAARAGDQVWKLVDSQQLEQARARVAAGFSPIPLSAVLYLTPGQPARLQLNDGQHQVLVDGPPVQAARERPIRHEDAWAAIRKTGDSSFEISSFELQSQEACFLPVSQLNALRREALQQMQVTRLSGYRRESAKPAKAIPRVSADPLPEGLYARCADPAAFDMLRQAGADHLLYSPLDYTDPQLMNRLSQLQPGDFFCLPKQLSEQELSRLYSLTRQTGVAVMADNLGQLQLDWPSGLLAGPGIPVWNREAADHLRGLGLCGYVYSRELCEADMMQRADLPLPGLLPVYGRAEVMLLNHCPERTYRGLTGSQTSCKLCDAGEGTRGRALTDRLGAEWPLSPQRLSEACLNRLYFHQPLHLSRRAFGHRWLLDFSTEPPQTQAAVTRYYAALMRGNAPLPELDIPIYLGRLEQGVQ